MLWGEPGVARVISNVMGGRSVTGGQPGMLQGDKWYESGKQER